MIRCFTLYSVAAAVLALATFLGDAPEGRSLPDGRSVASVRQALQRLPYYGVFDFLAFGVDGGTVTLVGYAYRPGLKSEAAQVIRHTMGVDAIVDKIETLPRSPHDDRIRWATFHAIYTDGFLSRYAPGGGMVSRYDLLSFTRFPGMQPFGNYPIHIVVKNGRTMLLGVVDTDLDKTLAGLRAREVRGVFTVDNELVLSRN